MSKTTVIYITFLAFVVCQKLLKSANVSWSYSENNTGTSHGVSTVLTAQFDILKFPKVVQAHTLGEVGI